MAKFSNSVAPEDIDSRRLPWPFVFNIQVLTTIGSLLNGRQRLQQHGPALSRTFVDAQPAWRGAGNQQAHLASADPILSERKRGRVVAKSRLYAPRQSAFQEHRERIMCFERLQERHRQLPGDAFRPHKQWSNRLDHAGITSKVKRNAIQILKCSAVIRVDAEVNRGRTVRLAVPRILPGDCQMLAFDARRVMGLLNDEGPIHAPLEVRDVQGINAVAFDLGRSSVEGKALL